MLKMNYSDFKGKNYSQLVKECSRRGIYTFNHKGMSLSADDLVGKIIAHDAYYEGRNDVLNDRAPKIPMKNENKNRKRYCLRCDDADPYYLKLTKEQAELLDWAISHELYLPNAELDEMDEVNWMEP